MKKNKKPLSRRDSRCLAFQIMYAWDRFDYDMPLENIVENFEKGFDIEIPMDSLAVQMVQGSTEQTKELDEIVKPLLQNWKIERIGCCTKLILRLALWELIQPESIPSVVINEAVELAKAFAEQDAHKFVNGILDKAKEMISETKNVKK